MREQLADLCHKQWAAWMDYLFSKCDSIKPTILEDRSLFIQESNRKKAIEFLKIINVLEDD